MTEAIKKVMRPAESDSTVENKPASQRTLDEDYFNRPLVFEVDNFVFPYLYRFPGQEKSEKILYINREAKVMLNWRLIGAGLVGLLIIGLIWGIAGVISSFGWTQTLVTTGLWLLTILVVLGTILVMAWLKLIWQRTIGILTNYRFVKLVQINPINNIIQSLPIKEVVDTSAEIRTGADRLLGLSSFTARSGANSSGVATEDAKSGKFRVNKKYFYFENITDAVDLENYYHKLRLATENNSYEKMLSFRPFITKNKNGSRQAMMDKFPEYWG